jgi:hypothetical protein
MVVLLYTCLNGHCSVMYFRTTSGKCESCGEPGYRVMWALKPPRAKPPD